REEIAARLKGSAANANGKLRKVHDLTQRFKAEPEPDPLAGIEPSDDVEADITRETAALDEGFRARMRAENNRVRTATDSEHWVALCFRTREDKEKFLRLAGAETGHPLIEIGDKYLDGYEVAARIGIDMTKEG
ncbi:hypothetical protein, partial [Salinispora vitiensis]